MTPRRAPFALHALIASNARLWAGEAEVFAAYFRSPGRDARSDALWLGRQCFKELVDGAVGRLERVTAVEESFARVAAAARTGLADEIVGVEVQHYVAFGIAHRLCLHELGEEVADPERRVSDWPENRELQSMRTRHRREHGELGERASVFTEGGYGTLYSAGMALERRTGRDDAIATACALVFDDEWGHMLAGIAGLSELELGAEEWALLEKLTVEQGRARIRMRNAQFGEPLAPARVRELEGGAAAPLAFDYARAGLLPRESDRA